MITPYQEKYLAWDLSRKRNSADEEKLTGVLSEAKVDLNPHQVEAALFAFRSPLSKGAVLADEVGLGKTIEAALVISQKWAERHRRILIIAPATLRKQWSMELEEKFFLPSLIMEKKNFTKILEDNYKNPFDDKEHIIICSYPFARKNITHISRIPWDLIVLDEAHSLRNVYKPSNKTGNALKEGLLPFKKILLTATPLQNDIKELFGLVSIIDDQYFGSISSFANQYSKVALREEQTYGELRQRILPIIHRTLRQQVQAYVKYTNRIPMVQEYVPTQDEQALSEFINDYLSREHSYGLPSSQRNLITLVLYKLLASSSFAIAGTLDTIIKRLEKIIEDNKQVEETDDPFDMSTDMDDFSEYQEEWIDEEDEENEDEDEEKDTKHLTSEEIEEVKEEIGELRTIYDLALSITANSKGACLIKALSLGFEKMKENGANQKALIFTESRRTQNYLLQLLEENGYKDQIVLFNGGNSDPKSNEIYNSWKKQYSGTSRVTGSKTADKRLALVDYFKNEAKIMIATEAAAEGINLQFCSLVVNYDLPWNPQRIEQRIGRCHRYGQKNDVVVVNFINKSNIADQRVYELLDEKFNLFKGVFGASDEVLGAIGNGVDFERRILSIYSKCRTKEEIDTAFTSLREDMRESIDSSMQDTRMALMTNFDEEVCEKFIITENKQNQQLQQHQRKFWILTQGILNGYISLPTNGKTEFTLKQSPVLGVPTGRYSFDKESGSSYLYRISHPLGQYVVNTGKKVPTPFSEVDFLYSSNNSKISIIEQQKGKSGFLSCRIVRYSSLGEEEEHIILVAIDSEGRELERDFLERLLTVPGVVGHSLPESAFPLSHLKELLDSQQHLLDERLDERNAELVDAESQKIENWTEDNRKQLQIKLKELDEAIKEKDDALMKERKAKVKLDILKERDALKEKRDAAWREFDTKKQELNEKKNEILTRLYALADGKVSTIDEYIIKWRVK